MGVLANIRDLAGGGAAASVPPRERKRIVFVNGLLVVGLALTLLFAPMQIIYGDARTLAVYAGTLAIFAGILVLNRIGRHSLAATAFCLAVWAVTSAQAAVEPPGGSVHFFLLPSVILPFLTLADRQTWLAFALSTLPAATFLAFVHQGDAPRSSEPVLYLITMTGVVVTIVAAGYYARTAASRAEDELDAQRRVSEDLLLNILPVPIAERLKRGNEIIADELPDVSVLFLDIVGFTRFASEIPAEELVRRLSRVVSCFDRLAARCGLEKIKTLGDGYMAAAGLPLPRSDHAHAAAEMAIAMRESLQTLPEAEGLQVRIGIASGSVIAGVIGETKFAYDLWGDTVNTAARMEETCIPGEIQISEATRERLAGAYVVEERAAVQVKGKGELRTFLLKGRGAGGAETRE